MSEQSLSVTFSNICDPVSDRAGCEVSLEHDDILNGGVSEFEVGGQIFYRAFPATKYTCYLSFGGTISIISTEKLEELAEDIVFSGSKEAQLSYPLDSSFTYDWIGSVLNAEIPHSKSTPRVIAEVGSTLLTVKDAIYGILKVTYKYSYASIKFLPMHPGKQIVLVCRICDSGEEACAFIVEDIEDQAFDDVTLTISDACNSELKVAGAQVEVNGELIEAISDSDGKIHVGLLAKGTHSIKVIAPGYIDSNADNLSNDEIIVE